MNGGQPFPPNDREIVATNGCASALALVTTKEAQEFGGLVPAILAEESRWAEIRAARGRESCIGDQPGHHP
jgi:hypothetical protein